MGNMKNLLDLMNSPTFTQVQNNGTEEHNDYKKKKKKKKHKDDDIMEIFGASHDNNEEDDQDTTPNELPWVTRNKSVNNSNDMNDTSSTSDEDNEECEDSQCEENSQPSSIEECVIMDIESSGIDPSFIGSLGVEFHMNPLGICGVNDNIIDKSIKMIQCHEISDIKEDLDIKEYLKEKNMTLPELYGLFLKYIISCNHPTSIQEYNMFESKYNRVKKLSDNFVVFTDIVGATKYAYLYYLPMESLSTIDEIINLIGERENYIGILRLLISLCLRCGESISIFEYDNKDYIDNYMQMSEAGSLYYIKLVQAYAEQGIVELFPNDTVSDNTEAQLKLKDMTELKHQVHQIISELTNINEDDNFDDELSEVQHMLASLSGKVSEGEDESDEDSEDGEYPDDILDDDSINEEEKEEE